MGKHLTKAQVKAARAEYCDNHFATTEYLAAKYDIGVNTMHFILSNKTHHDPGYVRPKKKGGRKKAIFLPDHIQEAKDELAPIPQTAHRARGQNYVINKFS